MTARFAPAARASKQASTFGIMPPSMVPSVMRALHSSGLLLMLALGIPAAVRAQAAPAPQNATLRAAIQAYENLDFTRAITLARRALSEHMTGPDQARAYELLGFSYSATDSQVKAVDAFKQAILLDPDRQLDPNKVSPKITSLFYSALGQVLVVRQLQADSARFIGGQGAVPLRQIGTATSNLTLFQQVGGSVGLAAAGTVFGSRLVEELPRQLAASSLPPQIVASFSASGAGSLNRLTGVGDLGQAILAGAPVATRAQLEPFVPDIVGAIHRAFSLATASTFDFGIVAALVAVVMVVFLREAPMRGPVREEATAAPPSPDRQPSPLAGEAGK